MHIERVLSFNNGWDILTTQKSNECVDIVTALGILTLQHIKSYLEYSIKKHDAAVDRNLINIIFNIRLKGILEDDFNWHDVRTLPSGTPYDNIAEQLTKNGVSIFVASTIEQLGGTFASNFYLKAPYLYNSGKSIVSVIIAPTRHTKGALIDQGIMLEDSTLLTDVECQAQLARFGLLTSKAPIVLAFFSPTAPEEIAIEEATALKLDGHTIERTIEFAPEYYQASVGLLSYFGEILRQKDPNTKAKVRIEQDGNRVRLHIESPGGDIEIIEKELEQYALVVSRQAAPETLLENRAHIMQLETQLDITRIQVKQAQDLMQLAEGQYTQRINNLEKQVEFLQTQFAAQILQTSQVINLATKQSDSHERIQTALLAHADTLFKDLMQEASGNQRLLDAISSLSQNLFSGLTTLDVEEQIKQALETVKQTKPGMLARIYTQVESAALKAGAGAALGWAAELVKHSLPPH
jgi:hypothetical protein